MNIMLLWGFVIIMGMPLVCLIPSFSSSAFAMPPVMPLEPQQFPPVQVFYTTHNKKVLWVERPQKITELEIFFEQGGEKDSDALLWVEQHWKKEQQIYTEELLRIGGYLRFSMRNHSAFAQLVVPKGSEIKGLSILKAILNKQPSTLPADPPKSITPPWELPNLLSLSKQQQPHKTYSIKEKKQAYRRWLKRAQPRFIIVGAEPDQRLLRALGAFWPQAREPAQRYTVEHKEYRWMPQKLLVEAPLGMQADIFLYIPLPTNNPSKRYNEYRLFNSILGGHFSSRLSLRLRQELGLVYSVFSSLQQIASLPYIEINVRASYHDIPVIYNEMYRIILSMQDISDQEFQTAKAQLLIKDRLRSNNGRQLLAWLRYNDDFQGWMDASKKQQAVELHDLNNAMKGFFKGGRNIWIVHASLDNVKPLMRGNWHILSDP